MRMIALSQEGYPPSRKSLVSFGIFRSLYIIIANKPVKFAEMQGIHPFTPLNQNLHNLAVQSFHELANGDVIDVCDRLLLFIFRL